MTELSEEAKDIARDTARLHWPAYQAVMLNDLNGLLQQQREVSRANYLAHGIAVPEVEADNMIHLGDHITIHAPPAAAADRTTATQQPEATPSPALPSWAARVAPWLLGPAAGAAAAVGYSAMSSDSPEPAPTVEVLSGQWYEYEIEPWKPREGQ